MLIKLSRKENPCIQLTDMQIGTATVENNTEFPQKLKTTI